MKILIVIDMQNDFLHGALKNEEGIKIIPAVVEKIKQFNQEGWPVFATQDTHFDDYMQTQEGEKLPVPHCIRYSKGWRINEEVLAAFGEANTYNEQMFGSWQRSGIKNHEPSAIVFEKNTFGSTDLANYLKNNYSNIQKDLQIELCGVCTDICVISNAMLIKASLPEAKIIVHSSLCAGVTVQSHKTALDAMRACQIEVL